MQYFQKCSYGNELLASVTTFPDKLKAVAGSLSHIVVYMTGVFA